MCSAFLAIDLVLCSAARTRRPLQRPRCGLPSMVLSFPRKDNIAQLLQPYHLGPNPMSAERLEYLKAKVVPRGHEVATCLRLCEEKNHVCMGLVVKLQSPKSQQVLRIFRSGKMENAQLSKRQKLGFCKFSRYVFTKVAISQLASDRWT